MKQPAVKIGARVRDDDPRMERIGEVVEVDSTRAKVRWSSGRTTTILLSRIKAKRGRSGYSLVEAA